jgi:hypothetical protein
MTLTSFLSMADHLAAVVVIATMLFVSVLGYRRTKMFAFLCLICGSLIFIILAAVLGFYKPASTEGAVVLLEWCHVGHFAATVFCGIGIFQLVKYVRREFERKSPPPMRAEPSSAK